ncbi:serine/threonine-protein kinase [Haloferula sp. A504]|uniref:serine/threonine-protein kinase n=1 Tax=Haloferula sp. A504 TaxID=3373601 RepID=UPI0037AC2DAC
MHIKERYEIRDTLGKGGLGTVYKAYDRSLKREVAIKRIKTGEDGQTEEAARQMEQETGALAALQHPHIVTIYDTGTDDEGPFVVMELLKGNTLDELVERAPLTWPDFRELVQQIMEGLIAAQDLGLLHRDLKPSNVMINWLPSGKFQAKIVDFGLAKFSRTPSSQTIDQNESVYGSIFYMAPEQFERTSLDTRTDMYAIGCVYYFALTGQAPFNGDTGPQVMASHLEHRVVPLGELRSDVPKWAADWIMWHMNRIQSERPENAREALKSFIELDKPVTQSMSTGHSETPPDEPKPADAPKRPRLIIPGANPEPAASPAPEAQQPPSVQPVAPAQPVQPVAPPQPVQPVPPSPPAPASPPAPESQTGPVPPPPVTQTAPQPLTPPEGAPPSIHTTAQQADASTAETAPDAPPPAPPAPAPAPPVVAVATPVPSQPAPAQPVPSVGVSGPATHQLKTAAPAGQAVEQGPTTIGSMLPPKKKGLGSGAKVTIAVMLSIVVVILGWVVLSTMSSNKINKRYNELVAIAAEPSAKELPVSSGDLEILLNSVRAGSNSSRETVYKALAIAKAKGSTDVDARIAEFATTEVLPDEIRVSLLERVLRRRASTSTLPVLMKFARETDNDRSAAAALTAVAAIGGEDQIDEFLELIQFTSSDRIRIEAEKATASALERSDNRAKYGPILVTAAENAVSDDTRRTMLRLLGFTGSDVALEKIMAALKGDDRLDTLAALQAAQNWPDDSMFEELVAFLETQTDELIRRKTFEGALAMLTDRERAAARDELDSEDYWKMLARNAKTEREQFNVISGLARTEWADWALSVVEYFVDEAESDNVIDQAERALLKMRERAKIQGGGE